jgi:hypothetical protein
MSFGELPLVPGGKYRVLDHSLAGSDWIEGEELTFVRCRGYLRYDEAFVYEFRTAAGEVRTCCLSSNMTEEQLYELMVLVF